MIRSQSLVYPIQKAKSKKEYVETELQLIPKFLDTRSFINVDMLNYLLTKAPEIKNPLLQMSPIYKGCSGHI